jgi:hypothetical protein
MNRFKSVLDDLELKQLYLHSRCFTWRSEISFSDRFIFCNRDWEITNSNCYVQGRESAAPCKITVRCSFTCSPLHHSNLNCFGRGCQASIKLLRKDCLGMSIWVTRSEHYISSFHVQLGRYENGAGNRSDCRNNRLT